MENQDVGATTTNPNSNHLPVADSAPQPSPKQNKWLVPALLAVILILLASTSFFGYHYFQPNTSNIETQNTKALNNEPTEQKQNRPVSREFRWKDYSADNQKDKLITNSEDEKLYKSPSVLSIVESEVLTSHSCLDISGQVPLKEIQASIDNGILRDGIEQISEHTFTSPVQKEDGTPLPPIKSKYEISFTSICETSKDSFVAVFITTTTRPNGLSLIPQAHAAGGWLGDSHLAIIEQDNLQIFERFPFDASLIELPSQDGDPVLLRFGAYYNCREVIATTQNNLIIDCNRNLYTLNSQTDSFQELAICGSYVDNGSYMTNRQTCFDSSGEMYYDTNNSSE